MTVSLHLSVSSCVCSPFESSKANCHLLQRYQLLLCNLHKDEEDFPYPCLLEAPVLIGTLAVSTGNISLCICCSVYMPAVGFRECGGLRSLSRVGDPFTHSFLGAGTVLDSRGIKVKITDQPCPPGASSLAENVSI